MRFLISLMLIALAVPCLGAEKGWGSEWDKIVIGARKEGKVVVRGSSDPILRRELPAAFEKRFGVVLEYSVGRSSEVAAKLRLERQAGISSIDVFLGGIDTVAKVLYAERMIDAIKPLLLLPDVLEPSKWKGGKLWFADPDGRYVLRLQNFVSQMFHVNVRYRKREDLRSIRDVLHPEWKGKITAFDPTVPGEGVAIASALYLQLGEEFVKKLYVDQRPVISRDARQMGDWVARGTYPLAIGVPAGHVERLQSEGFPIATIFGLPDFGGIIGAGAGLMAVMNKATHPNGARLFVNWIASKEGLEFLSRVRLVPTTRIDVDESFLPAEQIPRPGISYFDNSDWDYALTKKEEARLRMIKILKSD